MHGYETHTIKKALDLIISAKSLRISNKILIIFPTPVVIDPGFGGCGRNQARAVSLFVCSNLRTHTTVVRIFARIAKSDR